MTDPHTLPEIEVAPPEVEIDTETQERLKEQTLEERQVTVHCTFKNDSAYPQLIRIWPSTVLADKHSSHRSNLIYWENITLAPHWTPIFPGKPYQFTLIFSALPQNCILFDFFEDIPQEGGFLVSSIARNKTDVYHIDIEA